MALLTNRLDLCIQGLFGAAKSKSMAVLILALLELDVTDSQRSCSYAKKTLAPAPSLTCSCGSNPPSGVLGRIGRLVGDQERNKSSYSHTKFDINPRERRQMLSRCQLVMATGGTIAQDLTMQWSTLGGFMQELSLLVIDEGQQYGTDREIAVISLLNSNPSSYGQVTHNKRQAASPRQHPMPKDLASYCWPKNTGYVVTETILCLPT